MQYLTICVYTVCNDFLYNIQYDVALLNCFNLFLATPIPPHSPALAIQEDGTGALPERLADGREAEGRGEGVRVGAQCAVAAHLVRRELARALVPLLLPHL